MNNNIFKWILVLAKHKKSIIFLPIIGLFVTYGICLLLPVWFQAKAIILPPYEQSSGISSISNLGGILGFGGGGGDFTLPIMKTQTDLWAALAKNRTILDSVIVKENLIAHYETETLQGAREKLRKHLDINTTGEGLLEISVEAKAPILSAHLTNSLVEELDKINRKIKIDASKELSSYLGGRLENTEIVLRAYEDSLVAFQQKYGAISIKDQARLMIENAAQLESQMLINDIELGLAQKGYSKNHSKVQNLRSRKFELKNKLNELEYGRSDTSALMDIPLVDVPKLGLEYSRLLRETAAREVLYTYLLQSYEQAILETHKDIPVMRILADATPPEKKSRPVRSIISILSSIVIFFFTICYILFKYYLLDLSEKSPETFKTLTEIRKEILGNKRKDRNVQKS